MSDFGASLSRRERQMMDIVYRKGRAAAGEILDALEDPPSYSAVRTTLGLLEKKGWLTHIQEKKRYVYIPSVPREKTKKSALRRLVQTFFENSTEEVMVTLLNMPEFRLKPDEMRRVSRLIAQARKEGR